MEVSPEYKFSHRPTAESTAYYDTTDAAIEKLIEAEGWVVNKAGDDEDRHFCPDCTEEATPMSGADKKHARGSTLARIATVDAGGVKGARYFSDRPPADKALPVFAIEVKGEELWCLFPVTANSAALWDSVKLIGGKWSGASAGHWIAPERRRARIIRAAEAHGFAVEVTESDEPEVVLRMSAEDASGLRFLLGAATSAFTGAAFYRRADGEEIRLEPEADFERQSIAVGLRIEVELLKQIEEAVGAEEVEP